VNRSLYVSKIDPKSEVVAGVNENNFGNEGNSILCRCLMMSSDLWMYMLVIAFVVSLAKLGFGNLIMRFIDVILRSRRYEMVLLKIRSRARGET